MLGLRGRIALSGVATSAAALAAVVFLIGPGLRERTLDHARQALVDEARLMARLVEAPLARDAGPDELDAMVDQAAREVRARVTIVARDGRVLADSAASGAELARLENHANRPEVRQAHEAGAGTALRRSATVREELIYAAVAVRSSGRLLGVARVALPLTGVDEQVGALRRAVLLALLLAFAISAALSAALSPSLAGPLQDIVAAARAYAGGDLNARIPLRRHDELGELARLLNLSLDQLQERLTESARDRARTDAMLKALEDGLMAVDHRGMVLLANDALRRSLELTDPVGLHYLEALRQREVGEVVQQVLRSGQRCAVEVEIHRLRRVFALTGIPFPASQGTPPGALLSFHDVTERRRHERIRRDFVANASHELRTPLTSIRGFVEALEDGALETPGTGPRFLGKIRTHADRMAALVEDLLELSRLESGERPARLEELPAAELAEDVVGSFADLAARKPVALDYVDGGAPVIWTDAERVRRILENLVDNAIKYTPAGGHVQVVMRGGSDGGVVLEVRDDGLGIGPEHLPRIFERFYRVDKARSRDLGGTGLGLAIVKHLAESIGATLTVESEPGRGACFRVALPRERVSGGAAVS